LAKKWPVVVDIFQIIINSKKATVFFSAFVNEVHENPLIFLKVDVVAARYGLMEPILSVHSINQF
jgi:hypothetical protein